MIQGIVQLEDTTINFKVNEDNQVTYTVSDGLTGAYETKTVNGDSFMVALGLALSFDGSFPEIDKAYSMAESIQPESVILRFIP